MQALRHPAEMQLAGNGYKRLNRTPFHTMDCALFGWAEESL
jgi:hypothetical protein